MLYFIDRGLSNFKPDYTINASLSVSHVFLIAEASESDNCDNCDSDAAKMSRGQTSGVISSDMRP